MSLTLKSSLLVTFLLILTCNCTERGFLDFLFSPCKCRCGIPNREARFHGGEFLKGYEFPWIALIHTQIGETIKTIPGTLINNKYIITSASPLINQTPYSIKVTLGAYDRCVSDISSLNISIEEIFLHPDFSQENNANDLALLKLSNPVLFDRRISPICLSIPGHSYLGQVSTIVGWTKDKDGSAVSCRPKKLGLPVLSREECIETTPEPTAFSDDKGCVGLVGVTNVVCSEDVGTPVMFRSYGGTYELLGILTRQNQCILGAKSTSFYVKINRHLSWIINNTKDACYCIKT